MLQHKQDLGFRLAKSFRRFVVIESQNSPCCSVVHTVNQLGPELTIKYIDAVLNAIKSTPEYIANSEVIHDRLLCLFVRSAIRKSLLDITDKPSTMYLPSFKKDRTMPIDPGKSRATLSKNIRKEMLKGKPQNQAIAIAMNKAGMSKGNSKAKAKKGKSR
jgi:hypothetical protein